MGVVRQVGGVRGMTEPNGRSHGRGMTEWEEPQA